MTCKNCGKSVPAGAKFCPSCGTKVEENAKSFCSACGKELNPGAQFCQGCGMKVGSRPASTAGGGTGRLLESMKLVSFYKGEPKIGVAQATGTLSIYDDRLEFKKQMGNALATATGLIGMAAAHGAIKKDPLAIYPINQISQLRVGKYGGVYNTLVVAMKDGSVVSFCPGVPASSAPQNIIDMLRPYM